MVYTAYTFPQPMPKLTTPSRRGFSCQSWEVYSSDRDKIEKFQEAMHIKVRVVIGNLDNKGPPTVALASIFCSVSA